MSTTTTNLALVKPTTAELADITVINSNMDLIDTAVTARALASRTINGHALTGDVSVTASDVSLGNCNNTSDANKPVSTATQTALDARAPWRAYISPYMPADANSGWATNTSDTACFGSGYRATDNTNSGNSVAFNVVLSAGTWALDLLYTKAANAGIMTISLGATSVGTVDAYASSTTRNQAVSFTGISVATAGVYSLSFLINTKGSGSAYAGYLQGISLRRTA